MVCEHQQLGFLVTDLFQPMAANLDPSFMGFLETYFPREVKAKQRDNERAVAVDKWGEAYVRCLVM